MASDLSDKFTCTNCQEDISGMRVRCNECTDFELCLQCFAAGAEIGSHQPNHAYKFMDPGILSIFRGKNSWSAREELHLLDAVEQFGFGNWEDIAKHIETRSPEDAKEEYISKFLSGTIGRNTWKLAADQRPKLTDHTDDDSSLNEQCDMDRLPAPDITTEEAGQLCYMPNRDDYEREYDASAEQLVSNFALQTEEDLKDTDLDITTALKLAQVNIYTRRLRERARRKRLVRDYQLINNFYRGSAKRANQTRDEREFRERLRTFAQFYTCFDYERLITSLERERILRIRLTELFRYRWNGLTKIEDCVHFEQHAAANQSKTTGPYGHGKTERRREATFSGRQFPTDNTTTMKSPLLQTIKKENDEKETSSSSTGQRFTHPTGDPVSSDALWPNRSCLDNGQYPGLQQPDLEMPLGANLLTFNEIQLCSSLNLPPTRYVTIKTVLLSGAQTATPNVAEKQIKKYLLKSGWMNKPN